MLSKTPQTRNQFWAFTVHVVYVMVQGFKNERGLYFGHEEKASNGIIHAITQIII